MFKRRVYDQIIKTINENVIPILVGHRRTGKTTLLKQMSNEFKNPLYVSMDDVIWTSRTAVEVKSELISFINLGHDILLLDEIQDIQMWDKILKNLYDEFMYDKKIKIVVTGSSSLTFVKKETGVDRTRKILIGSLSYPEYLELTGEEKSFENFEQFLSIGGFPRHALDKKNAKEQEREILAPIINSDIPLHYSIKQGNIQRLLIELTTLTNGEFNKTKSSKNTGLPITQIDNYLDILEECQIIKRVYKSDEKGYLGRYPRYKIYINPHFHLWLINKDFSALENKFKGHIIESYWVFINTQIYGTFDKYFYYKDNNDKEIDFVLPSRSKNGFDTIIEFKYADNIENNNLTLFTQTKANKKIVFCKNNKTAGNTEFKNIIDFDFKDRIDFIY